MDHHCRARARHARPKRGAAWATLLALAAVASACERDAPKQAAPATPVATAAPTPATPPAPKAAAKPPAPPPVAVKALEWDAPPEWKSVKPNSSMRRATYEIPPPKGKADKVVTELNVFILGGDVEPNIQRWIDEFTGFDPKTLIRSDRTVNDMTQVIVEVPKGKFSGGMNTLTPSDNHGLLGAIVVTPEGVKYFFKMMDSMRLEGSKAAPASAIPAPPTAGKAPAPAAASAKSAPGAATPTPDKPKAPAPAVASPAAGAQAPAIPEATPKH
jgi:hypothetical protein